MLVMTRGRPRLTPSTPAVSSPALVPSLPRLCIPSILASRTSPRLLLPSLCKRGCWCVYHTGAQERLARGLAPESSFFMSPHVNCSTAPCALRDYYTRRAERLATHGTLKAMQP